MITRILACFAILWLFLSCAVPKPLEGGPKDETPPVLLSAEPDTLSTRVDVNLKEARLYFDEYIKPLRDAHRQIIISPPLKRSPIFSPRNLPRKYIGIKFQDSLEPNTTYIINFGESVQDNTEGNKLSFFAYVFSTGETLDSIKLSGKVGDAYDRKLEKDIIVGLYKADSAFNDSLILSEKPYYIARADKDGNYQITHIKEGRYILIAFNDSTPNYIYNPKNEKLGFVSAPIDLKKNESFDLRLSKEVSPLKVFSPKHVGWGHIAFPFEGPLKSIQIKPLKGAERELFIPSASGDSIDYWYKPADSADQEAKKLVFEIIKNDPLSLKENELSAKEDESPNEGGDQPSIKTDQLSRKEGQLTNKEARLSTQGDQSMDKKDQLPKKVEVNLHKEKPPEFSLQRVNVAVVPGKPVWFESETPIFSIDAAKVKVKGKDSADVPFQIVRDSLRPKSFALDFPKELEASYKMFFDTAAVEDILGNKNPAAISFSFALGKESDYGNLEITLSNLPERAFWFQLLNDNDKIVEEFYGRESQYAIRYLEPGAYYLRVIVDENEDKIWNPGNFKLRRQPEPVYFYDKAIRVRAFWDIRESWALPQRSS